MHKHTSKFLLVIFSFISRLYHARQLDGNQLNSSVCGYNVHEAV